MPRGTALGRLFAAIGDGAATSESTVRNRGARSPSKPIQNLEQLRHRREELVDRLQQMARDEARIQGGNRHRGG